MLLGCLAPNGFFVVTLERKLLLTRAIREHRVDLRRPGALRHERDALSVGAPRCRDVDAARRLDRVALQPQQLLVAGFDLGVTEEAWALGYAWDIVLGRGGRSTPPDLD